MENTITATTSFALYHLPGAEDVVYISDEAPLTLDAYDALPNEAGFVIAPFQINPQTPLLFLRPRSVERIPLEALPQEEVQYAFTNDEAAEREDYAKSFAVVERALRDRQARKVVLSRRMQLHLEGDAPIDARALMAKACRLYPRNFVAVWHTPQSGTWMVATPECLLEQITPTLWRTMALAGTMSWEAGAPMGRHAYWSPKDKAEQEFVRDYIRECILPYAEQLEMSHTYPVRAGELAHLRTDFTFTLAQPSDAGRLLSDLHPTPAVCGLPTSEAREIIAQAEPHSRRYYAGFAGPWHLEAATHLYVSLRCMHLDLLGSNCTLYAGGGILRASSEGAEWWETVRKAGTMLRVLGVNC